MDTKPKLNFWIAENFKLKPVPRLRFAAPGTCRYCDQCRTDPMMPYHEASDRCESGKHNHCTCDTCF
jgi:hypothetical protein